MSSITEAAWTIGEGVLIGIAAVVALAFFVGIPTAAGFAAYYLAYPYVPYIVAEILFVAGVVFGFGFIIGVMKW